MKKTEILHSRNLFKRIALKGKRLDGTLLRCSFLLHDEGETKLQVGFKIPSRKFNAVQRNKIKRWMREGWTAERTAIEEAVRRKDFCVGVIIYYRGLAEVPMKKLTLSVIQKDIGIMCRGIASVL